MLSRLQFTLLLGVTAFFFLLVYSFANAQNMSGLSIDMSTLYPKPGEEVTLTANIFSVDLNAATITWSSGGKTLESGIGKKQITVTAPEMGKTMNIKLVVTTSSFATLSTSVTLYSGTVDMILESDGFTPPFFKGKINPVFQNKVKIVAIPHMMNASMKEYSPSELIYTWKRNEKILSEESGYGRNSLTILGDVVPRDTTITVTVQDREGERQTMGYTNLEFKIPEILFYKNDPLYGVILNDSINQQLIIGKEKETGVFLMPYGFNDVSSLNIAWRINGKTQPNLINQRTLLLRAPDVRASSNMEIEVKNDRNILQFGEANLSAYFNGNTPTIDNTNPFKNE